MMIESRKQSFLKPVTGTDRKMYPGDRGAAEKNTVRWGIRMYKTVLPQYMEINNLSIGDVVAYTGRSKSIVRSWLHCMQPGKNRDITKFDFWKIVEATEPQEYLEYFNKIIDPIDKAMPKDIALAVLQFSYGRSRKVLNK